MVPGRGIPASFFNFVDGLGRTALAIDDCKAGQTISITVVNPTALPKSAAIIVRTRDPAAVIGTKISKGA